MNNTSKVTLNIYNAVKIMLKAGATNKEIAQYMGLSATTIGYIKASESYEEYKQIAYESSGRYKKMMKAIKAKEAEEKKNEQTKEESPVKEETTPQVVEHRQTVTLVANHYMAEEMKKQTELLTLINNKLTLIAEDLGCFKEVKENG